MNALRLRTGVIVCLFILLAAALLTPSVVAQSREPDVLRIVDIEYPIQVPRSYSFSVKLRVEYAFHDYYEVHAAIYEGQRGALDHSVWESNPERLISVNERIYEAELKSPSHEEQWVLTSYVFFRNASGSFYFTDQEQGPGFAEMVIKVSDTARLVLQAPHGNIPLYVDGASYSTDANGMLVRELTILTEHKVAAPVNVALGEGWRAVFRDWNGTDSTNPKTLMITSDVLLTADFSDEFYLTIASDVPGVSGGGWYPSGAIANFTAQPLVPSAGWEGLFGVQWRFVRWSGDVESTAMRESTVMDRPHRIVASWTLDYGGWFSLIIAIPALLMGGLAIFFVRRKARGSSGAPETPAVRTFCMFCGAHIEPDARFCSKCGKSQASSV